MRLKVVCIGLIVLAAAPALAEDGEIMQIRQTFDPPSAEYATGAVVNFVNADDVSHNLVVTDPKGAEVDFGVEKPGETTSIPFAVPGVYSVTCHIHPRMKMKVTVH